ncbi:MAG: DUF2786 domain-containing protein, partial [Acidimicrobiales bacterium]
DGAGRAARSGGRWRPSAGDLVIAGARAAADRDVETLDLLVDALATLPGSDVAASVESNLDQAVSVAMEHGWQPLELVGAARRKATQAGADLAAVGVLAQRGRWPAEACRHMPYVWAAQIEQLEATVPWRPEGHGWWLEWSHRSGGERTEALSAALGLLGVLISLPALAPLVPPPSAWASVRGTARRVGPVDDPVLQRVRGLLAKAESTSFPDEAEALTAKAQELMARHSIDAAMVDGVSRREGPEAVRIWVDNPYAAAKSELVAVVAGSNRCRCVWHPDWGFMTVIGHRPDLEAVDVLFTSLLLQATRSMLAKGHQEDRYGRSRTRSFRQSFLIAFARRIHERLAAAAAAAERDARAVHGGRLLPVLASRADAIEEKVAELFPRTSRYNGPAVNNRDGWVAGRTAAELASLGPDRAELFAAS